MINAARGGHQKEADIVRALDDGTLKAASLDVFEVEPLPQDSPLWGRDDVYITPHIAAASSERTGVRYFSRVIKDHEAGKPLPNVVDPQPGLLRARSNRLNRFRQAAVQLHVLAAANRSQVVVSRPHAGADAPGSERPAFAGFSRTYPPAARNTSYDSHRRSGRRQVDVNGRFHERQAPSIRRPGPCRSCDAGVLSTSVKPASA